jgi:hypothetical protein
MINRVKIYIGIERLINMVYEVQILTQGLTWEDACELEIMMISYYGRKI